MSDATTLPRSFTVIVNPVAGRGRARTYLPDLAGALGALADLGTEAELRVSTRPDEAPRIAEDAFARGRAVIAGGGDGLLSQLAPVAMASGGVLGVIPLGSGNDTARALGYDHADPLLAIGALGGDSRGRVRTIDVARANGRIVLSVAATGFDSEANRWANTVTRLRGGALYLAAVARTVATYRPHRFRITVDGVTSEITAWLVAVANTPNYAGGMRIAPDAVLDDGLLDITIVGPMSRAGFLRTFPGVYSGRHVRHPMVETIVASSARLESLDTSVPIESYADGERIGPLPVQIDVLPQTLRVVVPR